MTNITDLSIDILEKIINYKLNELIIIDQNNAIYDIIKIIINFFISNKLFYSLYNTDKFWNEVWDKYIILNKIYITSFNINNKSKLLLHIIYKCSICGNDESFLYNNLNIRLCKNCFTKHTISFFSIISQYNNIIDPEIPYYLRTSVDKIIYDPFERIYLKKDIFKFIENNHQLDYP